MPYVEVEDVDATVARVPELGGQVYVKPQDIPGVGRFAVLGDPTGATFGLLRSAGDAARGATPPPAGMRR